MKTHLKIFLIIIYNLTFINYNSRAQTYPVQLSTQLIPPYSGYLPDYADPSSEKLRVILQFNDFTIPQYNVRLKLEIKGNGFSLTTKQLYNPPPLQIQPGVPLLLSGADLAPYLNSNNLDFVGINQSQYEQRMALPEGYYTICVTAYDYYNSGGTVQVSHQACAQAWFTLSDPPFLNLPFCNTSVTPQTPQNIFFQWTPMNMGSPNSALNTEYVFELWECRPDTNANPNQIALSTAPIFSITTQQTMVNYGLTEPPLNLYMKYVWRVRAKDVSGRDLFKNQGYSQICTFNYGSVASILGSALTLNLTAQGVTHRMGKCTWNTQSLFTTYKLHVRKQGTTNWFDYNTTQGSEKVTNLEPNTDYEAQVQGEGNGITSAWSNIATFKTNNEQNYSCNDQTQLSDPLQAQPLPINKAIIGLIIQTGQFEVITTQITPTGAPGWYSGKGYARVFGILPLAVQWSNIYIDDNNRHQQGVIQAMTKGIDAWVHQWEQIADSLTASINNFNQTHDSLGFINTLQYFCNEIQNNKDSAVISNYTSFLNTTFPQTSNPSNSGTSLFCSLNDNEALAYLANNTNNNLNTSITNLNSITYNAYMAGLNNATQNNVAFKKININDFKADLIIRSSYPDTINQSQTNLCGIAAITRLFAIRNKENYIKAAISLYVYGYCNISGKKYVASELLKNEDITQGLSPVDFILMSVFRNSSNILVPYTPQVDQLGTIDLMNTLYKSNCSISLASILSYFNVHDQGLYGFSWPNDISSYAKNLSGLSTVFPTYQDLIISNGTATFDPLFFAEKIKNQGGTTILLVDWSMLTTGVSNLQTMHYVTYNGNYTINNYGTSSNVKYTFNIWHWGKTTPYPLEITKEQLEKGVYMFFYLK